MAESVVFVAAAAAAAAAAATADDDEAEKLSGGSRLGDGFSWFRFLGSYCNRVGFICLFDNLFLRSLGIFKGYMFFPFASIR